MNQTVPNPETQSTSPSSSCSFVNLFLLTSFCIGALKLLTFLFKLLYPFIRKRLNLKSRYGKGWALVTGASEGIGLGFAKQLASCGFNVFLVSRSQKKLIAAAKQISNKYKDVEVKFKSIDLQISDSQKQYSEAFKQIMELDVAVLVNNVGYFLPHKMCHNSFREIRTETRLNTLPIAVLSRLFLPQMLKRTNKNTRSAVINLSSSSVVAVYGGISNYASTKLFDDYFSRAVSYEYPQIDFLSVKPFLVTTAMTRFMSSLLHVSGQQCARGSLDDLGYDGASFGHWKHRIQGQVLSLFGSRFTSWIVGFSIGELEEKYNQIDKKEKN